MHPKLIPSVLVSCLLPALAPAWAANGGESSSKYALGTRDTADAPEEAPQDTEAPKELGPFAKSAGSFLDWLASGETYLNLYWRFEVADVDGFSEEALSLTLRTALGYRTAEVGGFQGLIEFEDVSSTFISENKATVDGSLLIVDPAGTEVNQVYVDYKGLEGALARVGRQNIVFDNSRWIGDVVWRQNRQTFDAATARFGGVDNLDVQYSYLHNVNRITGANELTSSHLFNARYTFPETAKAVAYIYHLDFDSLPDSTATFGLRVTGDQPIGESFNVAYEAEYAHQVDVADNPNDVDADYYHLALKGGPGGIAAQVGLEVLGGSTEVGNVNRVTTPLATAHKFNGWADLFLTTPPAGIQDLYFGLYGTIAEKTKAGLIYHSFSADAGNDDYGDEIDAILTHRCSDRVTLGFKAGNYMADDFGEDTLRAWVWIQLDV